MTDTAPPYSMTVSLDVLDPLSEGLYSSVAAVMTEAVANAWDADAATVKITINEQDDKIVIADDGVGMSRTEVNERY